MEGLSDSEQIVQDVCSRVQGSSCFLPNSRGVTSLLDSSWKMAQRYRFCCCPEIYKMNKTHHDQGDAQTSRPWCANSPRGAVGLGLPVLRASSNTTRCPESPGSEPPGGRTHRPHRLHLKDLRDTDIGFIMAWSPPISELFPFHGVVRKI